MSEIWGRKLEDRIKVVNMDVYQKIDEIKEKIKQLTSNLEDLRSDNLALLQENQLLHKKLIQKDAEIRFLKSQLTNYKEKLDDQVFGKTLREEEY